MVRRRPSVLQGRGCVAIAALSRGGAGWQNLAIVDGGPIAHGGFQVWRDQNGSEMSSIIRHGRWHAGFYVNQPGRAPEEMRSAGPRSSRQPGTLSTGRPRRRCAKARSDFARSSNRQTTSSLPLIRTADHLVHPAVAAAVGMAEKSSAARFGVHLPVS